MAGRGFHNRLDEDLENILNILRGRGAGIGRGRPVPPPMNPEIINALHERPIDEEAQIEFMTTLHNSRARAEEREAKRIDCQNAEAKADLAEIKNRRKAVELMTTRNEIARADNALQHEERELQGSNEILGAEMRMRRH